MFRRVLLIEPNYKNKYPPLSLMKLATYHRILGDEVKFFKGTDKEFAVSETMSLLMEKLYNNEPSVKWNSLWDDIEEYIIKGGEARLEALLDNSVSTNVLTKKNLEYYRKYYYNKEYLNNPQWDRVCITTLFTFYWDKTIKAINYFKQFCKDKNQVFVGGISASVVPVEMEKETGIKPIVGLLNRGGELDKDNDIIIEELPLDYSILDEIEYEYPEHDGYYGYMTRGCINECAFCVVPKLEPIYQSHIPIKNRIDDTRKHFGEKRNLLLLDNNVLASKDFERIIEDIKSAGFVKNSKYVAPNYYNIAISNLKSHFNDRAYLKNMVKQYNLLLSKTKDDDIKKEIIQVLSEFELDNEHTITVNNILRCDEYFKPLFEVVYANKPKQRCVDFNQGIDARLVNEENIKLLAQIPIKPLRIAFDHWEIRDIYKNAIELAAKNGITHLSNYLLYNFRDKPIELYKRMKMNVDLCVDLDINIYSFPMKYHPIQDPTYFRDRDYIGKYWNRKYIRAIQAVLNSTKGKIGRGKEFFERAFGENEEEFYKRLVMPEAMLIYRNYYEFETGIIDEWWYKYKNLSSKEASEIEKIISVNVFDNIESTTSNPVLLDVLKYYQITRDASEALEFQRKAKENHVKPQHSK